VSARCIPAFARQLERLTREIAATHSIAPEHAQAISEAQIDYEVVRARRAKLALIESFGPGSVLNPRPIIDDARGSLAVQPNEGTADLIRRLLPEILKLDRYEQRARSWHKHKLKHLAGKQETDRLGIRTRQATQIVAI
jgi:hypothetical protein